MGVVFVVVAGVVEVEIEMEEVVEALWELAQL